MIAALALTFDEDFSAGLVSYSGQFGPDSEVCLDTEESVPHITLVQFDCEGSELEGVRADVESSSASLPFPLTLAGLCLLPAPTGEVWVEIPVLGGKELMILQESLLGLPSLAGKKPYNGIGRAFRPHVTVALYGTMEKFFNVPKLPVELLRAQVDVHLSLAFTGPNYTLRKPIWTAHT